MPGKQKLFLFDIDGTLLSPGLLPRQILNQAFIDLVRENPDLQFSDVAGSTDPAIIINGLKKLGYSDGGITNLAEQILKRYLEEMTAEYPRSDLPFLFDDAVELLESVQSAGHIAALMTGNVEAGARIKLDRFALFQRFDFGVFGDDSADRNLLPGIAREKARDIMDLTIDFGEIIIVGDTPSDARAASFAGTGSIIVCRRPGWEKEIYKAGAGIVVSSLAGPEALQYAFGGTDHES